MLEHPSNRRPVCKLRDAQARGNQSATSNACRKLLGCFAGIILFYLLFVLSSMQLGAVGGECCVANDPIRMEKLAQELQLAQSVGELNRRQAEDKRKKAVISEDLHREQVQKAKWHDGMGLDEIDKLTVPQLEGIAFVHFHLSCTNPLGTGLN